MDDSNVVKVLALGFNELCVAWICCGQVTDVVISPFSSPFSTACNSHAEGERAWKWCTAAHHRWWSSFSSSLLLTIVWTAIFTAPPPHLRDGQLPPKGSPRESLSSMRGSKAGVGDGRDGDKRYAVWCSSLVSGGKHSTNPQSKESNQRSSASNAGIMFYFLRKPHIYSVMCSLKDSPPDDMGGHGGGFNLPDHSHLIKMHCFRA